MKATLLEQTGAVELLLYLRHKEKVKMTELLRKLEASQSAVYKARDLLLKEGLIFEEELIEPLRRVFTLTEKGQKVADHLAEIDKIVQGV